MFPIAAGVGAGLGIAQSIIGGVRAHKAEKEMEGMVNGYKPNASILDYYNKALERYNVNPYQSSTYRTQKQNIDRNTAAGMNAAQDRRGGLSAVGVLTQGANDASLKAVAAAEGQQAQALGQLGQATGMKAQEDFKPFEMKYNLKAMKAAGSNQMMNAGLQNVFNGAGAAQDYYTAKKIYGQ